MTYAEKVDIDETDVGLGRCKEVKKEKEGSQSRTLEREWGSGGAL